MAGKGDKKRAERRNAEGPKRITAKRKVPLPDGVLRDAGLTEGDVVRIRATGVGRIVLTRSENFLSSRASSSATLCGGAPDRSYPVC